MIAAIYARKSTDQNVTDEEKSVTRQVERARSYAAAKRWTISEGHVYVDDSVSGAEFTIKRRGYHALMAALRPRPPIQALIVMDQSRLAAAVNAGPPGAGSGRPRPGGSATRQSGRCSRRYWRS